MRRAIVAATQDVKRCAAGEHDGGTGAGTLAA